MQTHRLARSWWLPVVVAVLSAITAYLYLVDQPPRYEAQARLLVGSLGADFDEIRAAQALADTYVELARTNTLLDRAIETAGLPMVTTQLRETVSVVTVGNSRIVLVSGRHKDRDLVGDAVDAVAETLQGFDANSRQNVTILDSGMTPLLSPPRLPALVTLAAFGGAGVAVGLLLLLEAARAGASPPRPD